MARKKSITTIETEIKKVEEELSKTQHKYDLLAEKLLKLQKHHQEYEANEIVIAYAKSGSSFYDTLNHWR